MGIATAWKANKALRMQRNGNYQEAIKLYEEAIAEGMNDPRFLMPYALLIIRDGQYQKAREFLVAHQKVPMSPGQRTEMLVYYATCCFRLGNTDKGISTLEQQFRKTETGLLYQTLGYLYVDKYDRDHRPDFEEPQRKRRKRPRRKPRRLKAGKRRPCPRKRNGTRALKRRRPLSASPSSTTRKIPSAWTTWANSCTASGGTRPPRRNGLTRPSPSRKTRLIPCIS